MSQVNTVFELNPSRLSSDRIKIVYLGSLLTGDAAQWYDVMNRMVSNEIFASYEIFFQKSSSIVNEEALFINGDAKCFKAGVEFVNWTVVAGVTNGLL